MFRPQWSPPHSISAPSRAPGGVSPSLLPWLSLASSPQPTGQERSGGSPTATVGGSWL